MRAHLVLVFAALVIGLGAACGSSSGGSDGGGGHGGSTGTGGSGGTGGDTCSPACGAGSVCVASGVQGGVVVLVNDAGTCPSGYHPTGNGSCTQDLAYACMQIPAGCGGTVTCTCASSLCAGRMCDGYSGGLLSCVDLVP
jgi:hypothetical protein